MQKVLDTLKSWSSFNSRKHVDSPYADVMERTVAWALDLVLLYYILRSLFDRLAMVVFRHDDPSTIDLVKRSNFNQLLRDGQTAIDSGQSGYLIGSPALHLYLTDLVAEFFLLGLIVIGAQCIYGNTPGKWLLGLKIARRTTHEPISRWRYLLRYLAYIPSVGFLMLGVVWAHFNSERRTVHDIIAGTVVLQTRREGWYWNKVKQGYRWVKNKLRPATPPANDNDNSPA